MPVGLGPWRLRGPPAEGIPDGGGDGGTPVPWGPPAGKLTPLGKEGRALGGPPLWWSSAGAARTDRGARRARMRVSGVGRCMAAAGCVFGVFGVFGCVCVRAFMIRLRKVVSCVKINLNQMDVFDS